MTTSTSSATASTHTDPPPDHHLPQRLMAIPDNTRRVLARRLDTHRQQRWPNLTELSIRFRGHFVYLTSLSAPDGQMLARLLMTPQRTRALRSKPLARRRRQWDRRYATCRDTECRRRPAPGCAKGTRVGTACTARVTSAISLDRAGGRRRSRRRGSGRHRALQPCRRSRGSCPGIW